MDGDVHQTKASLSMFERQKSSFPGTLGRLPNSKRNSAAA
jgi:hypothetical protein